MVERSFDFVKQWFANEFTLTKRQLGFVMIVAGIVLVVLMLLAELAGDSSGLGAIQWLGIGGGVASVLVGATLLPLGDQHA